MNSLEHINVTVSEPHATAELLCALFDWQVRWSGKAQSGGNTVHVGQPGDGASYLALYAPPEQPQLRERDSVQSGNLNHIAIVVDDLDDVEQRAKSVGLRPFNHGDYHPGRRFYLMLNSDLEAEVVTYQP